MSDELKTEAQALKAELYKRLFELGPAKAIESPKEVYDLLLYAAGEGLDRVAGVKQTPVNNSVHVMIVHMGGGEQVEIRRLEGGALVGLDCSFLEMMSDECTINNPYDAGHIHVPVNERPTRDGSDE
jgi:hypothetical protein